MPINPVDAVHDPARLRRRAALSLMVILGDCLAADPNPNDWVDPKAFGAVGDGLADDTAALAAAFSVSVAQGRTIRLAGTYRISGPLQPYAPARPRGALHIWCASETRIEVDAKAAPFGDLLYVHTQSHCHCTILGEKLIINGANRVGRGITVRQNAVFGASVRITAGLHLQRFFERDGRELRENAALAIIGDYAQVEIKNVTVDSVRRTNPAGANKGIAVAGFGGSVLIADCTVKDIRVPSLGSYDADGIAVFAKPGRDFYLAHGARAVVQRCTLTDCQGRSVKSQCSNTTIIDPVVHRQHAVSIRGSVEFDFQVGNGSVVNPQIHYRANGWLSPLGVSHSCIAFQQLQRDGAMHASATGGRLNTEVPVPRYVAAIYQAWSADSRIDVQGLHVVSAAKLAGGAIHRAVIEMDMSQIASSRSKVHVNASAIVGDLQCPVVGYHSHAGQDVSDRLSVEVSHCINNGPERPRRWIDHVSGPRIACLRQLKSNANQGFSDPEFTCT